MTTVTFDTLKFVETLKTAGVPEIQAKAQAEAMKDVLSSEVATKNDLDKQSAELKLAIAETKGEVNLVKWMLGFSLAMSVTMLFKLFG